MLKSLSPIDVALIKKIGGNGSSYTLPIASSTQLGGVQPAAKTETMTQAVGVDADGALWTEPGSAGKSELNLVWSLDVTETLSKISQSLVFRTPPKKVVIFGIGVENSSTSNARASICFYKNSENIYAESYNLQNFSGASGKPMYASAVIDVFGQVYSIVYAQNTNADFHSWNHTMQQVGYYANPEKFLIWDKLEFNAWNITAGRIEIWSDAEVET